MRLKIILLALLVLASSGCRSRQAAFVKENLSAEISENNPGDNNAAAAAPAGGIAGNKTQAAVQVIDSDAASDPAPEIFVDVCGAVASPGVYRLPEGSRVFAAIEAAGGSTGEAALRYVNQAFVLSDGMQLYIPSESDVNPAEGEAAPGLAAASFTDSGGRYSYEALSRSIGMPWEPDELTDGQSAPYRPYEDSGALVDINRAGPEELCSLSGIGESKAAAIIRYRETHGPFRSIEDLKKVEGIKEGTFSRIKDAITVSGDEYKR